MQYSKRNSNYCLDIGKEEVIIEVAEKLGLTKHEVENDIGKHLFSKEI